jgi:hypothetical protein
MLKSLLVVACATVTRSLPLSAEPAVEAADAHNMTGCLECR